MVVLGPAVYAGSLTGFPWKLKAALYTMFTVKLYGLIFIAEVSKSAILMFGSLSQIFPKLFQDTAAVSSKKMLAINY